LNQEALEAQLFDQLGFGLILSLSSFLFTHWDQLTPFINNQACVSHQIKFIKAQSIVYINEGFKYFLNYKFSWSSTHLYKTILSNLKIHLRCLMASPKEGIWYYNSMKNLRPKGFLKWKKSKWKSRSHHFWNSQTLWKFSKSFDSTKYLTL
jgi:hypothetical protein